MGGGRDRGKENPEATPCWAQIPTQGRSGILEPELEIQSGQAT